MSKVCQGTGRSGFTVIELAAVLTIAALFGFLFLPFWAQLHNEARAEKCAMNLGQIGRAVALYAADHRDALPGCQHSRPSWTETLRAYTDLEKICPNESPKQGEQVVALNDFLTPRPHGARRMNFSQRQTIPAPAETLLFTEVAEGFRAYDHFHFAAPELGFDPENFAMQVDVLRHGGAANYLFSDGHVQGLDWSGGVKPKLTHPRSRFVHPTGGSGTGEIGQIAQK